MIELGVNIDHVATVRQARRTYEPDPVWAAVEAHLGGADGITCHLREDRRLIQDEDVRRLRELTHIRLNLEMAATEEMADTASPLRPAVTAELKNIQAAGDAIRAAGMLFNAGHALNYFNVEPVAALPGLRELHIGHAIVSRAVFVGMREAVREMKQ